MMLDVSTLTTEDVTGHLWVVDERMKQAMVTTNSKAPTDGGVDSRMKEEFREASFSCSGDDRRRDKLSLEKRRCGKMGH